MSKIKVGEQILAELREALSGAEKALEIRLEAVAFGRATLGGLEEGHPDLEIAKETIARIEEAIEQNKADIMQFKCFIVEARTILEKLKGEYED